MISYRIATLIALAALAGCGEAGEAIFCRPQDEAGAPPACEAYYDACINQAAAVYIVDIRRVGRALAREVYEQHQATCESGWSVCVEQAQPPASDGGYPLDGGTQ